MPPDIEPDTERGSRPSPNRSSPPWPTRPGAPSWPRWPSGGPATATDLAGRLPITRQAIAKHLALLAEAGLVTAEPGERRRVRYRLRSAPMQVAQQFLAALARDWDSPLGALKDHLDRDAAAPPPPCPPKLRHTSLITIRPSRGSPTGRRTS